MFRPIADLAQPTPETLAHFMPEIENDVVYWGGVALASQEGTVGLGDAARVLASYNETVATVQDIEGANTKTQREAIAGALSTLALSRFLKTPDYHGALSEVEVGHVPIFATDELVDPYDRTRQRVHFMQSNGSIQGESWAYDEDAGLYLHTTDPAQPTADFEAMYFNETGQVFPSGQMVTVVPKLASPLA